MAIKWFPQIQDRESAMRSARQGAIAAVAVAALSTWAGALIYVDSGNPGTETAIAAEDVPWSIFAAIMIVAVVLIAAWRIYSGKGWIIAPLLTVLFTIEIITNSFSVAINIGWTITYVVVVVGLVNGVRGCWWIRWAGRRETAAVSLSKNR